MTQGKYPMKLKRNRIHTIIVILIAIGFSLYMAKLMMYHMTRNDMSKYIAIHEAKEREMTPIQGRYFRDVVWQHNEYIGWVAQKNDMIDNVYTFKGIFYGVMGYDYSSVADYIECEYYRTYKNGIMVENKNPIHEISYYEWTKKGIMHKWTKDVHQDNVLRWDAPKCYTEYVMVDRQDEKFITAYDVQSGNVKCECHYGNIGSVLWGMSSSTHCYYIARAERETCYRLYMHEISSGEVSIYRIGRYLRSGVFSPLLSGKGFKVCGEYIMMNEGKWTNVYNYKKKGVSPGYINKPVKYVKQYGNQFLYVSFEYSDDGMGFSEPFDDGGVMREYTIGIYPDGDEWIVRTNGIPIIFGRKYMIVCEDGGIVAIDNATGVKTKAIVNILRGGHELCSYDGPYLSFSSGHLFPERQNTWGGMVYTIKFENTIDGIYINDYAPGWHE